MGKKGSSVRQRIEVGTRTHRAVSQRAVGHAPCEDQARVGNERQGPRASAPRRVRRVALLEERGIRDGVPRDREPGLGREQGQREGRRGEQAEPVPAAGSPAVVRQQGQDAEERRHQRVAVGDPGCRIRVSVIERVVRGGEPRDPGDGDEAAVQRRADQDQGRVPGEVLEVHQPGRPGPPGIVDEVSQGGDRTPVAHLRVRPDPPGVDAELLEARSLDGAPGDDVEEIEAPRQGAHLSLDHESLEEIVDRQAAPDRREKGEEYDTGEDPRRAGLREPLAHPATGRECQPEDADGWRRANWRRAVHENAQPLQQWTYRSAMTEEAQRECFLCSKSDG